MNIPNLNPLIKTVVVTIPQNTAESNGIDTEGLILVGITLHGEEWSGGAYISLKASHDGITYAPVGFYISTTQKANVLELDQFSTQTPPYAVTLNPQLTAGMQYLSVWSAVDAADVTQTAARTLTLTLRRP